MRIILPLIFAMQKSNMAQSLYIFLQTLSTLPPTIDAVLVVRCENCKYGYPCGDEIVCYHPEYELAEGKWSYKKDFFCAFGDTKEGAD